MPSNSTYNIPVSIETALREKLLTYFLEPHSVRGIFKEEPFYMDIAEKRYTTEWLIYVRRSLETAGLLRRIRGTTQDVTLQTTEMGKKMLDDPGQ